jgi:hypothetical protein
MRNVIYRQSIALDKLKSLSLSPPLFMMIDWNAFYEFMNNSLSLFRWLNIQSAMMDGEKGE